MSVFLRFLKPYKILVLFTLFVMVLDVAGALYIPTLAAEMINIGVLEKDMDLIFYKGGLMLLVTLLAGLGTLLGSYLCAHLSARIGRDMRNALYDKSLHFSSYDFEQFGTGSMITRTLSDVSVVQQAFVWSVQMILPVPVMCVLGSVMAFSIDRTMGILLGGVTLAVVGSSVFVSKKASVIFKKLQHFLDRINVVLRENLTGVRVIRAFNKEFHEAKRLRKSFEDYAASSIQANRLFVGLESLALLVINLCIVAILWLGADQIGAGYMKIGDITAVTEYAILILFYVMMAQMVMILLPRASVCMRRINAVLSHLPEMQDGSARLAKGAAEVCRFKDAAFRFADADEPTLHDLNFACRRGETTAIIGSTGSGKSTIAKLLLRFHELSEGAVILGGQDIRQVAQKELRERIAYVPQKAWLFSGTVADNLRYGNENATAEDMRHALDIAQADFVHALPDGLAASVAQGGTNFSGGQKQRLAIARALMKKADLYIFDDSFSALDFKTDAALRKALAAEVGDAAILIIAQRVNTILHADQIIVLEDGKIIGVGKHEELMQDCRVYQEIVKSQTKGETRDGK